MIETLRLSFSDGTSKVYPAQAVLGLGRRDADNSQQVDIDLVNFTGISRLHAFIYIDGETIYLEDFNSRNGTFLNGYELIPLRRYAVAEGANIRLGRAIFKLEWA
jgi:pSer/pThr/pTyr-binding forkhead associated (FHA) protein